MLKSNTSHIYEHSYQLEPHLPPQKKKEELNKKFVALHFRKNRKLEGSDDFCIDDCWYDDD